MSAQPGFGRRRAPPPEPRADEAARSVSARPSVEDEIAAAARAAFRQPERIEFSFEPSVLARASGALDDEEAMRAFIGPNWRAFERLWRRDRPRPRLRSSLGVGPVLFGAAWLVYRKRYLLGFGFVGAEMGTAFLAPIFALVISLILRVFVGRYGRSIVLKAGAAEVARVRSSGAPADAQLRHLRRAGGVTLWLPILMILGEAWLGLHRPPGTEPYEAALRDLDAAGLLANVRNALP